MAKARRMTADGQKAMDLIEKIETTIEEDVDERGQEKGKDFFEGILDTIKSMSLNIVENQNATPKQLAALHNMLEGVHKWVH